MCVPESRKFQGGVMVSGKTGMGSHKHFFSGHSGRHNADKQQLARDVNKMREKNKHTEPMYDSVAEAFAATRKK